MKERDQGCSGPSGPLRFRRSDEVLIKGRLARLAMGRRERRALLEGISDTGVPIGSVCLSAHRKYPLGSAKDAVRARGMETMEREIDLATDLGVRLVQLAGCYVCDEASTMGPEPFRAVYEGITLGHMTHIEELLASRSSPRAIRLSGQWSATEAKGVHAILARRWIRPREGAGGYLLTRQSKDLY